MSTNVSLRREARTRQNTRRSRAFSRTVIVVVATLALLATTGSVAALMQGPRLVSVTVNPEAAIESAGTRVILEANQALEPIDASQVTVTPAAPFTIDARGRSVGVRFDSALDDATTYTVTVTGVQSVGSGPESTLETSFETPPAHVFLLHRGAAAEGDAIQQFSVDAMSRTTVFSHPHIEEFRVAPTALVILVEEDDKSAVIVTDRDGTNPRYATLPGDGYVMGLQVADRSATFGYLFTDRKLTQTEGRASILYVASLHDPAAEPVEVDFATDQASIGDWMFVPESAGLLAVTFAGDLMLSDAGQTTRLATAMAIDGITRGTYRAIVDRGGAAVEVDLRTGAESTLSLPELGGTPGRVEPLAQGGELWAVTQRDTAGMPIGNLVQLVDDDGVRTVVSTPREEPILQFCVSPSGQYVAAAVAPDYANNPYDGYTRPMPSMLTRIVRVSDGSVVSELNGFDISWCSRSQM